MVASGNTVSVYSLTGGLRYVHPSEYRVGVEPRLSPELSFVERAPRRPRMQCLPRYIDQQPTNTELQESKEKHRVAIENILI